MIKKWNVNFLYEDLLSIPSQYNDISTFFIEDTLSMNKIKVIQNVRCDVSLHI